MSLVLPPNKPVSFAELLSSIRASLGLTQGEMALRFGVAENDIQSFEQDYWVNPEARRKILKQMSLAINWS